MKSKKINLKFWILLFSFTISLLTLTYLVVLENKYFFHFFTGTKIKFNESSQIIDQDSIDYKIVNSIQKKTQEISKCITPSVVAILNPLYIDDISNNKNNFISTKEQYFIGSGFFIDKVGHFITTYHVVKKNQSIYVLHCESLHHAKLVCFDQNTDLSVLKIEPLEPVQPIIFGNSESIKVGDIVFSLGNPFYLNKTITMGVVSGLKRNLKNKCFISVPYQDIINDFIQTDLPYNKGNDGSPIFDIYGKVIGMTTDIKIKLRSNKNKKDFSLTAINLSFAIPINKIIASLRNT